MAEEHGTAAIRRMMPPQSEQMRRSQPLLCRLGIDDSFDAPKLVEPGGEGRGRGQYRRGCRRSAACGPRMPPAGSARAGDEAGARARAPAGGLRPKFSRFPHKEPPNRPWSQTTRSSAGTPNIEPADFSFQVKNVGTRIYNSFAAQRLTCTLPTDASPTSLRTPAHGSGAVDISPRRTGGLLFGSMICSTRGRCAGKPRPRLR